MHLAANLATDLVANDVGANPGEFGRQAYTDGGVFDNLGVRMFRCLERPLLADSPLSRDDFFDFQEFVEALREAGANPLPVYTYSLRPGPDGSVPALDLVTGRLDGLIVTVLASGGASVSGGPDAWEQWEVPRLEQLDVPVIQGICATIPRSDWASSAAGPWIHRW